MLKRPFLLHYKLPHLCLLEESVFVTVMLFCCYFTFMPHRCNQCRQPQSDRWLPGQKAVQRLEALHVLWDLLHLWTECGESLPGWWEDVTSKKDKRKGVNGFGRKCHLCVKAKHGNGSKSWRVRVLLSGKCCAPQWVALSHHTVKVTGLIPKPGWKTTRNRINFQKLINHWCRVYKFFEVLWVTLICSFKKGLILLCMNVRCLHFVLAL